jgi:ABC-type Mn2+/Zn2+ transport system ATPase subunit
MSAIEARGLDVGYQGEVVVPDIELSVPSGASLALVGTNGSGKSTFIRTLVGLIPPRAGRLDVLETAPGGAPARLAYLSQFHASGYILPIRAADVVSMARYASLGLVGRAGSEDRDLVAWAMETMAVSDVRSRPMRDLSGGQRQRVYLAKVLAHRAESTGSTSPRRASMRAAVRATWTPSRPSCGAVRPWSRPRMTSPRRSSTTRCSCWPAASWPWVRAGTS